MKIGQSHCRVLISCVFLLTYVGIVAGRTFSLNEAIAAESKQVRLFDSTPRSIEKTTEKFSLLRDLNATKKNRKIKRSGIPHSSGILSPLYLKRKYQIKSPLKANNLLKEHKVRLKRKNQHLKREIIQNDGINKKYMPLFKSLSFLFDGILDRDSRESGERRSKLGKRKPLPGDSGVVCKCTRKSDLDIEESQPTKTTVTAPSASEVRSDDRTTTPQADTDSNLFVRHLKHPKRLSLLSPHSSRRNSDGFGARSSAPHQSSTERYNARFDGSGKHGTRNKEIKTTGANDKQDSERALRNRPRNDGGVRFRAGQSQEETEIPKPVFKQDYTYHNSEQSQSDESTPDRGNFDHFESPKFKVGGSEKQSKTLLRDNIRGFGKPQFIDRNGKPRNDQNTISSQEDNEGNDVNVPNDSTNDRRYSDRNKRIRIVKEDQKASATDEERVTLQDLSDTPLVLHNNSMAPLEIQNSSKTKTPMVTIIDGYSVARDKNGENKLNEKSIRIHS